MNILSGIDLIDSYSSAFTGKKLGLAVSGAAFDRNLDTTKSVLAKRFDVRLLLAPEHGILGTVDAGADVSQVTDEETGLPAYSIYSENTKEPDPALLGRIDALVYDMQDLGLRYYTYCATLINCMKACAAAGTGMIVLDRPNPLGGTAVEGALLPEASLSFVGPWTLPNRYALTSGELALMVAAEMKLDLDLTVVPCRGWRRGMLFQDTVLQNASLHDTPHASCAAHEDVSSSPRPWIAPSPAIPHADTALLYSGLCILEGTTLSEGRGTYTPFETVGAPFVNARELAAAMNSLKLDGAVFTPAWFTPWTSKHRDVPCQGVRIHITDRHAIRPLRLTAALLRTMQALYPGQWSFLPFFDSLMGTGAAEWICGEPDALEMRFRGDEEQFIERKKAYQLYQE